MSWRERAEGRKERAEKRASKSGVSTHRADNIHCDTFATHAACAAGDDGNASSGSDAVISDAPLLLPPPSISCPTLR